MENDRHSETFAVRIVKIVDVLKFECFEKLILEKIYFKNNLCVKCHIKSFREILI